MAITDENTVLILGAGSSVPFWMPLGGELMKNIKDQIDFERSHILNQKSNFIETIVNVDTEILTYPIHSALYKRFKNGGGDYFIQISLLASLAELLNKQTSETIDDFIVENPSFSELTKICIASIFMKKLYNPESGKIFHAGLGLNYQTYLLKSLAERNLRQKNNRKERNWVHLLINIVRQGIRQNSVTKQNKIRVISFNYDLILENILDDQFSNTENMEGKDWRDYFEILHPHGKCEPLSDEIDVATDLINEWADGIYVIQESEDEIPDAIKEDRLRAKEIISNAREIYATGFSFAGPNCRLLGLSESKAHKSIKKGGFNRKIYFCNWDGNLGLELSANKYIYKSAEETKVISPGVGKAFKTTGATEVIPQTGTPEKPLGVSDWIKTGVLGEMPG